MPTVHAVARGRVIAVRVGRRLAGRNILGQALDDYVVIDHGRCYSAYRHLDRVYTTVGSLVDEDAAIGESATYVDADVLNPDFSLFHSGETTSAQEAPLTADPGTPPETSQGPVASTQEAETHDHAEHPDDGPADAEPGDPGDARRSRRRKRPARSNAGA